MQNRILWPVIVVLVIGLIAIFYPRKATEPPVPLDLPAPVEAPAQDPQAEVEPEPSPDFVPEEPAEIRPPLPALDESDEAARAALAEITGEALVDDYLAEDSVVRKLVATIDSLSGEQLWMKVRAVPAIEGRLRVSDMDGQAYLAPANFDRYTTLALLVDEVDVTALAAAYQRNYPLLQQAYEELGYPGRQFHNRMLEVIDHLLETPTVEGPIRLERPHVLYKYADPRLEGLSSGQKIMIRIGPEHATIVRNNLVEFREALESLPEAPATD